MGGGYICGGYIGGGYIDRGYIGDIDNVLRVVILSAGELVCVWWRKDNIERML
jgi:hypothetical protein